MRLLKSRRFTAQQERSAATRRCVEVERAVHQNAPLHCFVTITIGTVLNISAAMLGMSAREWRPFGAIVG